MIKKFIIPIIIILLPLLFFYKLVLHPTDVLFPASDILSAYSPWRNFFAQGLLGNKIIPLWNPFEFSGIPFIANASSGIMYPFTILFLVFPVDLAFGYGFLLDFILLGLFSYLFMRSLSVGKIGSLGASIILTFSGTVFTRIYSGHLFILDTFLWFPLLLYFIEKTFKKENFLYSFYASIPVALMLVSGNPQIALYALLFSLIYVFLKLFFSNQRKSSFKYSFGIIVALFFGVLLSLGQTIPLLEFSSVSSRGGGVDYSFASTFSLPPKQLISFFLPFFFGSPVDNTFWGKGNFWELCGYIGIGSLIFVTFSSLTKKNVYVKIFSILALFSLIFSLGSYSFIFPFFYKFIPFFDLFRVPARFIFFYTFSFSVLAGIGIDFILSNKKPQPTKNIKIISFILISLGLILSIASLFINFISFEDLFEKSVLKNSYAFGIDHNILYKHVISSFSLFTIFILLTSIIIYASQFKSFKKIAGILIVILLVLELFIFDKNFLETKKISNYYQIPEEIKFIKRDKDLYRIYDFDTSSFHLAEREKIENITGYNPTYLSYYRDFVWEIGPHLNNKSDSYFQISKINNFNILRFLNVKYILSKNSISSDNLKFLYRKEFYVYELVSTLPRAYLIDFNTKENKNFKLPTNVTKVSVVRKNSNSLSLRFDLKEKKKLVLSEVVYPGWVAYDNYKEIKIQKFYIFRSFNLEKGQHNILLKYNPKSFNVGVLISLVSLISLIVIILLIKGLFSLSKIYNIIKRFKKSL